jgi:phage terminase large subunit-like protein
MVRMVLTQVMEREDFKIPIHLTFSKKSKEGRAEPVANLYDRGDVHHIGPQKDLADLELQMMYLHEGEDPTGEDFDRCDALVIGLTRLGLKRRLSSASGGRGVGIRTMGEFGNGPAAQGSGAGYSPGFGNSEF